MPLVQKLDKLGKVRPIFLLLACLAVYGSSVGFDFVNFDDYLHITGNPRILHGGFKELVSFWTAPTAGLYIPLSYTFWWLEAKLSVLLFPDAPLQPWIFHASSCVLHAMNVILVYRILVELLETLSEKPSGKLLAQSSRYRQWAGWGALFFAIHPLQMESVAWCSEQKGLLAAFFGLLSCIFYLKCVPKKEGWYWATLFFAFALLSKPNASMIPLALFLINFIAKKRSFRDSLKGLHLWLLATLGWIFVTRWSQPEAELLYLPPLHVRPWIAWDALGFYLSKILVPFPLGADYGRNPLQILEKPNWLYLGLPFLVLFLIFWVLFFGSARSKPKASSLIWTGLSLALIFLIPNLGLLPFSFENFSTVADRYLYLPLFGLSLACSALLSELDQGKFCSGTRLSWAGGIVAVALGVLSLSQIRTWRDSAALWNHTLEINPKSWLAYTNLGRLAQDRKEFESAIHYYTQSLEFQPSADALEGIGLALLSEGKYDEAINHYRRLILIRPLFAVAHLNLGIALFRSQRLEEAKTEFNRAIELDTNASGVKPLAEEYLEQAPQPHQR